jgi:CHAT domain-containing protein/Tfp pilus assembly protein PilF
VTTLPALHCRSSRVLSWMAGSAATLMLAWVFACSSSPPPLALRGGSPFPELSVPDGPVRLEKDVPREDAIAAGETREYSLSMAAGDYARVGVDQTKADVALRLLDPAGRPAAAADGPGGRKAPERLSWIAPAAGPAGEYRLEVSGKEAGLTRVTLEDLRPSKPGDAERVEAERGAWEALHWQSLQDETWKRKALARYEEVLALWERADAPAEEIFTLNQIGAIHRGFGDSDKALALYERALALALKTSDRRGEAQTRQNLGVAHYQQGKYPLANQDLQEAVRLWEPLNDSAELAAALYSLGVVQYAEGDPEAALASLERALKLRREAGESQNQAPILTMMATIYRDRGEGDRALEIGREALEISRSIQDRSSEAGVLQMMAGIYLRRGELQQALELYTSALQAQRLVGNRGSESWALSALGATTLALGEIDRALDYYSQALAIQTEMGSAWQAYTLRDLGWVFDRKGQPEKALEYYTRALQLSRQFKDKRSEALCLHGIGQARVALGAARDAVPILEQAIALYREVDNASGEINGILELGHAWRVLGDPDQAFRLFEQALDLSRERKALLSEAVAQSAIAGVEKDRDQLPEAAAAIEESLRIIESIRPKVASQRQRVSFFASRRESYDVYIDLQMRMHERDPDGGHLTKALAASERARARALLDLLAEGRIDVRTGISSELKSHEVETGNRVSLLQSQLLEDLAQGGKRVPRIEEELDQAEDERDRIEGQIRLEHPRYAAVSNPAPLQPRSIQELLDGHTAFLEYALGKEASYLFVVTRDRMEGYRLPPERELADRIETVREALQEPGRRQLGRYADAARSLYKDLLGPAKAVLRDRDRLIVAPDGPLLLLSFEALLTGPGGSSLDDFPYLIRERSVTYVPSASVFAELRAPGAPGIQTPAGPGLFVGFGDPSYEASYELSSGVPDASGTLTWGFQTPGLTSPRRLPESRREVLGIASLFPPADVRLYLDGDASEKNVRDNPLLKQARWIHFAVHGFLNEERPEYSGLLLARDDDPADNGLLQVYEIFNLELTADLVVLSACDTALGKNVSGEGLIGVSRALLYAGAASVVVSLWQVSDASTSDLMIRFYRHLSEGKEKSEALRLSKLEMIREGKAHPYYWAAFTLIGQPGSAVTSGSLARQ